MVFRASGEHDIDEHVDAIRLWLFEKVGVIGEGDKSDAEDSRECRLGGSETRLDR